MKLFFQMFFKISLKSILTKKYNNLENLIFNYPFADDLVPIFKSNPILYKHSLNLSIL
jgi:hypothetical protein